MSKTIHATSHPPGRFCDCDKDRVEQVVCGECDVEWVCVIKGGETHQLLAHAVSEYAGSADPLDVFVEFMDGAFVEDEKEV